MEMKPLHVDAGAQNGAQNGNSRPFIPASSQRMPMMPGKNRFGTYRETRPDKVVLAFAILFNCGLFILGCGALFVGIYLNTYRGSYADLCSDNEWFVAAGCMLAVGSLLFIFVIVAMIAIILKKSRILGIFILVLAFLFLGEMAAGVYAFARRAYIESRFKACMTNAYQKHYKDPEFKHVTEAWNTFQDRFDCCGVDDPLDYLTNKHTRLDPPQSCGGTREDASGRQPCFKVIRREVLDNFYIIGGSAVGIAAIEIFAIISNFLLLRIFHKREEYE